MKNQMSTQEEHKIIVGLMERPYPLLNAAKRIVELERENALLQPVAAAAWLVCDAMYGADHLKPFPIDMIPEDRQNLMHTLLSLCGAAIDGGALEE